MISGISLVAIVPPGCDYDNNLSQIIELCNQTLLIGSPPFLRLDKIIGAGLSRVLTLARTIADLAGNDQIKTPHIADGLQFRPKGIVQEASTNQTILTEILDLDHTTRTREFGTLGLGQTLKQLRDSGHKFPVYQNEGGLPEGSFKNLGALKFFRNLNDPDNNGNGQ
jgi:hypothetical protein